jgi:hypothetical protein
VSGHPGPAALARSALLADALDALGLRAQCLRPGIAPLDPSSRIAGRALTVALTPAEAVPDEPYRGLLAMLGAVRPGDVVVVATGRSDAAAVWGELTSSSCVARGAAGLVTDGLCRDVEQVRALGFPVFARGTSPLDVDGRLDFGPTGCPSTSTAWRSPRATSSWPTWTASSSCPRTSPRTSCAARARRRARGGAAARRPRRRADREAFRRLGVL